MKKIYSNEIRLLAPRLYAHNRASNIPTKCIIERPFRSCVESKEFHNSNSNEYVTIQPSPFSKPVEVLCDQQIFGGGWTVSEH